MKVVTSDKLLTERNLQLLNQIHIKQEEKDMVGDLQKQHDSSDTDTQRVYIAHSDSDERSDEIYQSENHDADALETRLEESTAKIHELTHESQLLRNKVAEKEKLALGIAQQADALAIENDQLHARIKDDLLDSQKFAEEIKLQKQKIRALKQKNKELNKENSELASHLLDQNLQQKSKIGSVSMSADAITQTEVQRSSVMTSKLTDTEEKNQGLQKTNAEIVARNARLQKAILSLDDKLKDYSTLNDELTAQLAEIRKKISRMEQQRKEEPRNVQFDELGVIEVAQEPEIGIKKMITDVQHHLSLLQSMEPEENNQTLADAITAGNNYLASLNQITFRKSLANSVIGSVGVGVSGEAETGKAPEEVQSGAKIGAEGEGDKKYGPGEGNSGNQGDASQKIEDQVENTSTADIVAVDKLSADSLQLIDRLDLASSNHKQSEPGPGHRRTNSVPVSRLGALQDKVAAEAEVKTYISDLAQKFINTAIDHNPEEQGAALEADNLVKSKTTFTALKITKKPTVAPEEIKESSSGLTPKAENKVNEGVIKESDTNDLDYGLTELFGEISEKDFEAKIESSSSKKQEDYDDYRQLRPLLEDVEIEDKPMAVTSTQPADQEIKDLKAEFVKLLVQSGDSQEDARNKVDAIFGYARNSDKDWRKTLGSCCIRISTSVT